MNHINSKGRRALRYTGLGIAGASLIGCALPAVGGVGLSGVALGGILFLIGASTMGNSGCDEVTPCLSYAPSETPTATPSETPSLAPCLTYGPTPTPEGVALPKDTPPERAASRAELLKRLVADGTLPADVAARLGATAGEGDAEPTEKTQR